MRAILFVIIATLLSCTDSSKSELAGMQYFPSEKRMKEGLVWKYFYHSGQKNGQKKTDIRYLVKTLNNRTLINEEYDAQFSKIYTGEIEIRGDNWLLIEEKRINYWTPAYEPSKEFIPTIEKNKVVDWSGNEAIVDKTFIEEGSGNRRITQQLESRDSLSGGSIVRVISGDRDFIRIKDGENTDTTKLVWENHYESGLGMTYSKAATSENTYEYALDEIISIPEFERRANHGTHRVAYIDTLQTIDDYTLFNPCYSPEKIYDYYNDERAQFKGGKGRLRALLDAKLDHSQIKNESGYLTFRFVINCEGKAGWFVTEEAGLDYNKKEFGASCREHLYQILKAEKHWTNLIVRGEAYDAYTYITFKMKDGEIIEILP